MRRSLPTRIRPLAAILALTAAVLASGGWGAAPTAAQVGERIVAIGDIHGAYGELTGVLRAAGLIDALETWTGGDATLVQTGDMLDRGADARRVMDLMIRLQGEARAAGGRVVVLLGNHEIMNLVGARQDVTPAIIATFADRESDARARELFREHERRFLQADSRWLGADPRERRRVQSEWLAAHPAGLLEMVRALGPEGSYGRWLRSLPATWNESGVLYMHAGISDRYADVRLADIDARVRAEIDAIDRYRAYLVAKGDLLETADLNDMVVAAHRRFDGLAGSVRPHDEETTEAPELPGPQASLDHAAAWVALAHLDHWYLFAPDGPMWFRGYARWDYDQVGERTPAILARLGVGTVVVGHTPQTGGIRVRAEGAVYLIDTGMLAEVYGGAAEALVLEAGEAAAIAPGGGRRLLPAPAAGSITTARPRS